MEIIILVFLIFELTQLFIAVFSRIKLNNLPVIFSKALSSKIPADKILEIYSKEIQDIKYKVSRKLKIPAEIRKDEFLIRGSSLHKSDMFTAVFLIWKLETFRTPKKFVQKLSDLLGFIFILQNILIIVAVISLIQIIGIMAIILTVFSNIIFVWKNSLEAEKFKTVVFVAKELLKFDIVEEARAKSLVSSLKMYGNLYPLEILRILFGFFFF